MNPDQYEQQVADYFQKNGYKVELTPKTDCGVGKMKTEIEVKKHFEEYLKHFDNVDSIENPERARYLSGYVHALKWMLEVD